MAELVLQGHSQSAIAQQLGVTQSLVSQDLKKIQSAWQQSSIRDFDEIRSMELAKLGYIEQEAWGAWKRSQEPAQTATVDGQAGAQKAKRTLRHQYGDPRFLDIVLRCNEAKRQMLGLDAPTKIAPTTPDGQPLTTEQRRIHIDAILVEMFGHDNQEKADEKRGKPASWSVCQIWEYWEKPKYLFLRDTWRKRVAWDGLKSGVRQFLREWRPGRVLIENAHFGPALRAELSDFDVEMVSPIPTRTKGEEGRPGKLERATTLLNMLEQGLVFLPRPNNSWLPDLETEWLTWTGLADETADQVDASAYAAYAARHAGDFQNEDWGGAIWPSGSRRFRYPW